MGTDIGPYSDANEVRASFLNVEVVYKQVDKSSTLHELWIEVRDFI